MISDIHFPLQLSGAELDDYLARGWYRMGQIIFTTDHLSYENVVYKVHWLRYNVHAVQFGNTHHRILRHSGDFDITIRPMDLTDEIEQLYALYKSSVKFEAPETVFNFLYDGGNQDIYRTSCIEVRDQKKLVAVGVFDTGENSMAGIMNFFDPAYRQFSPGKFLMLKKMQYAKEKNLDWYYPGYIVPGNPRFDYKLFLGRQIAEIFYPENDTWSRYSLMFKV